MGLASYTPERHEVSIGGSSFFVEGLTLDSISRLIQQHLPDLEAIFELFKNAEKVEQADLTNLATALVQAAPGLAANIIALGANEPDAAPNAAKLPAPLQIELILKIGDLTFKETGGVKKSMEMVVALLSSMKTAKPMLTEAMTKAA